FFLQNSCNISVFASFTSGNFNQFQRHVVRKAAAIFLEAFFHPLWHFGADGNQLNLHAQPQSFSNWYMARCSSCITCSMVVPISTTTHSPSFSPSIPSGSTPAFFASLAT